MFHVSSTASFNFRPIPYSCPSLWFCWNCCPPQRAHGAFNKELIRGDPPRTAVLGTFASTLLILLILAGSLVECMMSKKIGSVIVDVGIYGSSAIPCFVVIPAVVLSNWREDQMSKKNMTHLADCWGIYLSLYPEAILFSVNVYILCTLLVS